jgi:hypothetical protein
LFADQDTGDTLNLGFGISPAKRTWQRGLTGGQPFAEAQAESIADRESKHAASCESD